MSAGADFLTPIFHGGRFENASLPISVLSDLTAYRDLVVALARHLFFLREPSRKQVPRGFADSFQIGIRAIEAGSTVAVLNRVSSSSRSEHRLHGVDLFEEARDLIHRVIEAAASKSPLPREFPSELAKRFNQFGRGLRDDEYVELRRPGESSGHRYDRAIRKRIVVQQEGSYEDTVDLRGWISGGVVDREQLTIRLEGDVLIDGRCPAALVRQALGLLEQRVRVLGVGAFDRNDHLERILRIEDVFVDDEETEEEEEGIPSSLMKHLASQFRHLGSLPPGWFEPETQPLNKRGLDEVFFFLLELMEELPLPHMYPTPESEARAEWSFPDWEVNATFNLEALSVLLQATHLRSDASNELQLTLDAAGSDKAFVGFIKPYLPNPQGS